VVTYDFAIPVRTPTLNELLRMHFRLRAKTAQSLAWQVRSSAMPPAKPIQACNVIIERTSPREPDPDGLNSCGKIIMDILQPCSLRHPMGLGFIADDSSKCVRNFQVRHINGRDPRTRIIIQELAQ